MKKIMTILLIITAFSFTACLVVTEDEEVVNIRVHGYVRDKLTNEPLTGADIYINNGYIDESNEYAGTTDSSGYYDFNRDVWLHYATNIDVIYNVLYKYQSIEIDNNPDNEVNFLLEKY